VSPACLKRGSRVKAVFISCFRMVAKDRHSDSLNSLSKWLLKVCTASANSRLSGQTILMNFEAMTALASLTAFAWLCAKRVRVTASPSTWSVAANPAISLLLASTCASVRHPGVIVVPRVPAPIPPPLSSIVAVSEMSAMLAIIDTEVILPMAPMATVADEREQFKE